MQVPYCIEEEQSTPSLMSLLQETALFLWKDWPRDMQAVGHDASGNFAFNGTCPHSGCRRPSVFIRIQSTSLGSVRVTSRGHVIRWIAVMQCQGCRQYILGIAEAPQGTGDYEYVLHYPLGAPDDKVADEIPVHIKPDFQEALRCLWVKAYNATAEMCRRALEASCIERGAAPKDVLEDMIDDLESKRIITPFLRDVAHKIRLGGNRGAHPGEPAIAIPDPKMAQSLGIPSSSSVITEDHAKAIVKFTTEFFHHIYVVPKELDKYDFSKPKVLKQ